jgi:uncharacterized protein (DUF2141 family)
MKAAVSIVALCLFSAFSLQKTVLDIRISDIRSSKGVVRLSVYTAPEQYPYKPWRTYTIKKDSLDKTFLHAAIDDLKPGTYGLCMLDDENNSGVMENNLLGIPKEGFAFANNFKPFLKRPDYSQVLIQLLPGFNHIDLITRYKN